MDEVSMYWVVWLMRRRPPRFTLASSSAASDVYKRQEKNEPAFGRTKSYGGQFHMDYPGLEDKIIFGMGGFGGNAILIDVENSRILVLNSLHYNNKKYKYNHKKLILDPFKKGIN